MSAPAEAWFAEPRPFQTVLNAVRRVLLDLQLQETLKWRQPCYMVDGRNVAILGVRKEGCVLNLFQGAALEDPEGQLLSAGPNTRAARLLCFTSEQQVLEREGALRSLVAQAIALERAGRRVTLEPAADPIPETLAQRFDADPELAAAFTALTPGRQRGYLLHFNGARRAETCAARIEQARERILAGKGRHDCVCGRSARMPRCDGAHQRP